MLLLTIPVMLFPMIGMKSNIIFAVYVNIIGVIVLVTVLFLQKS